jgi:hypothetical protein
VAELGLEGGLDVDLGQDAEALVGQGLRTAVTAVPKSASRRTVRP